MKVVRFTRSTDNIRVEYNSTLQNVENVDENFTVSFPNLIDSFLENQLFYHFDRKKWTLNEMIFFANNNRLCIEILENNILLRSYGMCATVLPGDFNNDFNDDFY